MRTFARRKTREGWGDGLVDLGETRDNVVVLVGDNTKSTSVDRFAERWPERFYQMGIAEQNMVNVAAGLSLFGKAPYYVTYSAFGVGRVYDMLRVTVGYTPCNVKIGGAHSGLSVGPDGATHQMMEDIACMRALPNFTLLAPADYWETRKAVAAACEIDGPVYIRFGREPVPVVTGEHDPYVPGRATILAEGGDATCIACGAMVAEALLAHDQLAERGIELRVINMHTIKPLDERAIVAAARETGAIVTAEEHQLYGGLGSAVAQLVAQHAPVKMDYVAVMDAYGRSGDPDALLDMYGLRAANIVEKVKGLLQR
ncbi:MAG: 1-deoxy-D-xylulose-5-phosphate synthase [Calditrichaeota bacterium]|nr:1-deoxy-D-xylulose-5-phosphate synthase [Calditrichota bacterium]